MPAMGDMPMPGGWSLSMTWMRIPGQSWLAAEAMFVAMWVAMMLVMMLPSLAPVLWRERSPATLAAGYFTVWTLVGAAVFPLGAALIAMIVETPMLARATPLVAGIVVTLAAAWQFTPWKARMLDRCHALPAGSAWHRGVHHGVQCVRCCANLTVILLVVGVMDVRAMAVVGAVGTLERMAAWSR